MKKIIIALILMIFLISTAQAGYVPKEYQTEAKTIKNDIDLYKFAVKYIDQRWAYDILRQLAMQYTNNGRVGTLHITMQDKYLKKK